MRPGSPHKARTQLAVLGQAQFFMLSQSLVTTPCLHVWHDTAGDILHLDWQGRLTLSATQAASMQVAQLALARRYARVLICTLQVQAVGQDVADWLAPRLRPGLRLLGTHCLAWVCPVAPEGAALAQSLNTGLTLSSRLFIDTAAAVAWLQDCPREHQGYPQPVVESTRLNRLLKLWQWQVLTSMARSSSWLLSTEKGHPQPTRHPQPKAVEQLQ
jgi:hypothetical protein